MTSNFLNSPNKKSSPQNLLRLKMKRKNLMKILVKLRKNLRTHVLKYLDGFIYSVVAKTNVKAYAISKDDLVNSMPEEHI